MAGGSLYFPQRLTPRTRPSRSVHGTCSCLPTRRDALSLCCLPVSAALSYILSLGHMAHSRSQSSHSQPQPQSLAAYSLTGWEISFLDPLRDHRNALIILNQPFSFPLLDRLWHSSRWHACADGGANRLHDLLKDLDGKDKRHL